MSFSVPSISSLSDVIYLQWLLFLHTFLVPKCRLSEDLPHQILPFCSSKHPLGLDLSPVL